MSLRPAHAKSRFAEPLARRVRVGDAKRHQVHACVARQRIVEFAAQRSVRGLEQHLDIAARQHRGDVAGAGELSLVALDRHWRRRESGTLQSGAGVVRTAYEMRDMVEEHLLAQRQLAIGFHA